MAKVVEQLFKYLLDVYIDFIEKETMIGEEDI